MLEKVTVMIAAIATKIAVQMECIERAFRAMETLSMAEPEQNVKTGKNIRNIPLSKENPWVNPRQGARTEGKRGCKEFTTDTTKQ